MRHRSCTRARCANQATASAARKLINSCRFRHVFDCKAFSLEISQSLASIFAAGKYEKSPPSACPPAHFLAPSPYACCAGCLNTSLRSSPQPLPLPLFPLTFTSHIACIASHIHCPALGATTCVFAPSTASTVHPNNASSRRAAAVYALCTSVLCGAHAATPRANVLATGTEEKSHRDHSSG